MRSSSFDASLDLLDSRPLRSASVGSPRPGSPHGDLPQVLSPGMVEALLDQLPDDPFASPPGERIGQLLERRAEVEAAVVARLMRGVDGQVVPSRGYRAVYLISLAGQWRSPAATPGLLRHLATPWGYGWDELVHALVRVGGPAFGPVLFAAFDRSRSTVERRRALRALGALAVEAATHGDDPEWIGDADQQVAEATAALRLILHRAQGEAAELVDEAAHRLCDMGCLEAWDQITGLFALGVLRERDGFTLPIAADLMHRRLASFELGGWKASMTDWMLRA